MSRTFQAERSSAYRPWTVLAVAVLVFALTWLFRWLTLDFTNDQFAHLSRARQMLLGELPVRDFFDPGLPLHYVASAAALLVWGQNLFGEAMLTVTLVALGTALVFFLSARGARSVTLALVATAVVIATFPRLYNYPKVFLYPLALLFIWRYAAGRTAGQVAALAILTAVAFLFRHDHGAYIGLSVAVALILANTDRLRAAPWIVTRYAVITAVLLLPFFAYIQWTTGIISYFKGSAPQSQTATTLRLVRLPITWDRTKPWFVVDPPSRPRVSIRWQEGIADDLRREREQRYSLTDPDADGTYVLVNDSRDNIGALLKDPLVVDTHRIDRSTLQPIRQESWVQRLRNWIPLFRLRIMPGGLTPANAMAWLYYVTVSLPLVALLVLAVGWRRGTITRFDLAVLGAAIVMCVVTHQGLIRESPDSRLPDVIAPTMVLAAWTTALAFRGAPGARAGTARRVRPATAAGVLVAAVWLVTLWSSSVFGDMSERISASGLLAGPAAMNERSGDLIRLTKGRPIDWYAPAGSGGIQGLTRYVLDCTRLTDRVLVTWFEPQVFFYAERPFAGGQTYLDPGWHSSPEDQALTISRLRAQRVPIVLTSAAGDIGYHQACPLGHQDVQEHYVEAARSTFGGDREYAVFVDRSLQPRRHYEPLNLPCYR